MIEILVLAAVTGFLVKYVDLIEDDGLNSFKHADIIFGLVYGLLIGLMMVKFTVVAPLWLAVVVGTVLSGKIDGKGHYSGIFGMVLVLVMNTVPVIDWKLFSLFLVAAIVDELLNTDKVFSLVGKGAKRIFRLRLVLELTLLVLALVTGVWTLFMAMIAFDMFYMLAARIR